MEVQSSLAELQQQRTLDALLECYGIGSRKATLQASFDLEGKGRQARKAVRQKDSCRMEGLRQESCCTIQQQGLFKYRFND
jgi:hypothetical protein